jgi:hypothetical protein
VRLTTPYTNTQIAKNLRITPILDKLLEYKRSWIQHVNRMPRNKLPRVMKLYSPTGRRNQGRPLKRLLDTWDRNWVNKWLKQVAQLYDRYMMMMMMMMMITRLGMKGLYFSSQFLYLCSISLGGS